jgi:hypothetical protein
LKYPPFPWAQNFQDGAHQTTGAQRKIFEKGTIFFGHPVLTQHSPSANVTTKYSTFLNRYNFSEYFDKVL